METLTASSKSSPLTSAATDRPSNDTIPAGGDASARRNADGLATALRPRETLRTALVSPGRDNHCIRQTRMLGAFAEEDVGSRARGAGGSSCLSRTSGSVIFMQFLYLPRPELQLLHRRSVPR